MGGVFLSYASPDSTFALQLAGDLKILGYSVWLDQWEIDIGDSIPGKIASGLAASDHMVVVFSQHTARSLWVENEVLIKFWQEVTSKRTIILPALIAECSVPVILQAKRLADFRRSYPIGLAQLAVALRAQDMQMEMPIDAREQQTTYPLSTPSPWEYTDSTMVNIPRLTEVNVEIGLPYIGKISGCWKPAEEEQLAAWELYIELITRISIVELPAGHGLLRESLTSLYTIFTITREILHKHSPSIARPHNGSDITFGSLAIYILNYVLRPVLTEWHPLLSDYEHSRLPKVSAFKHEQKWKKCGELRKVLHNTQAILMEYTKLLAEVAQVPDLLERKA